MLIFLFIYIALDTFSLQTFFTHVNKLDNVSELDWSSRDSEVKSESEYLDLGYFYHSRKLMIEPSLYRSAFLDYNLQRTRLFFTHGNL